MSESHRVEQTVMEYLRGVNAGVIERMPDPSTLKLRRVLDSLDMAEFIAFLEQRFSFRVTDQEILSKNFETVGSVIAFVSRKTSGG